MLFGMEPSSLFVFTNAFCKLPARHAGMIKDLLQEGGPEPPVFEGYRKDIAHQAVADEDLTDRPS
jgi:hypothetical protein